MKDTQQPHPHHTSPYPACALSQNCQTPVSSFDLWFLKCPGLGKQLRLESTRHIGRPRWSEHPGITVAALGHCSCRVTSRKPHNSYTGHTCFPVVHSTMINFPQPPVTNAVFLLYWASVKTWADGEAWSPRRNIKRCLSVTR